MISALVEHRQICTTQPADRSNATVSQPGGPVLGRVRCGCGARLSSNSLSPQIAASRALPWSHRLSPLYSYHPVRSARTFLLLNTTTIHHARRHRHLRAPGLLGSARPGRSPTCCRRSRNPLCVHCRGRGWFQTLRMSRVRGVLVQRDHEADMCFGLPGSRCTLQLCMFLPSAFLSSDHHPSFGLHSHSFILCHPTPLYGVLFHPLIHATLTVEGTRMQRLVIEWRTACGRQLFVCPD
jgi:hypothetical protein